MIHHIVLEQHEEEFAPPTKVLKLSFSKGFRDPLSQSWTESVVWIDIADFDETIDLTELRTDERRQFAVGFNDLVDALVALGALKDYAEED
jgi:hypothetical protein